MTEKEILEKDKKVDWDLFISRHREVPPLLACLNISSQYPESFILKNVGINFALYNQKRVGDEWYWSKKEYIKLRNILRVGAKKNPVYLKNIVNKLKQNCEFLVNWCFKVSKTNYLKATNEELLSVFETYWEKLRSVASYLEIKHILNRVLEERIRDLLKKNLAQKESDKLDVYFQQLLVPSRETLTGEANKKLKYLADRNTITRKQIKNWLSRYNWIETFYWFGHILTREDVIRKIRKLQQEKVKEPKRPEGFSVRLSKSALREVKVLQDLLYLHTYELECLFASKYWCQNLLSEVAKRIGLSFDEYTYATFEELLKGLKDGEIDKQKIFRRKGNQYALFRFRDKISIFEGNAFKKILRRKQEIDEKISEVQGTVAFSGQVKGRVRIIKTIFEFNKFKRGDILITPMTTIDFTHFLKKAEAIVTDEGGITCHAAIISRELRTPCIIGTKIATKIFKDGDLVEVDANKGVVKLLKRKK